MRSLGIMMRTLLVAFLFGFASASLSGPLLPFSADHPVTICPFNSSQPSPPSFTERGCNPRKLGNLDPQNTAFWVLLEFDWDTQPADIKTPYGLYLFAKASSEVHLNGQLIGQNGKPAADATEVAGKMDVVFAIPQALLQRSNNRLVVLLSAQHSLVHLDYPIHFLGMGQFGDPRQYVQRYRELGLILTGAFIIGLLFFLRLGWRHQERHTYRLFAILCLIAALQLGAELLRGVFTYPYPWHDIRLLIITALSLGFGILILLHVSMHVVRRHAVHWIYTGILLSVLAVMFAPGFDVKTTAGVFVPLLVSVVQLLMTWLKRHERRILQWFLVQLTITGIIVVTAGNFHEILHFLIIAAFLGYLFGQHAHNYQTQQQNMAEDRLLIAKLEYKLAQNAQAKTSMKLKITTGDITEFLNVTDIAYGKAASDYVELHLTDSREKLYTGTLKQLQAALPETFIRVHRSYLVNLNEVTAMGSENTSKVLHLSNGQKAPVSRRLVPAVRESLLQVAT